MVDYESWWFFLVATSVKLLLFPSYHSTDFEVHRHWLALTSSLPLSRWYSDETSQWTLDYPPVFAHFERILSYPASLVDPTIVDLVAGLNYSATSAVFFQRSSVVLADLILLLSLRRLLLFKIPAKKTMILILVLWSPSLLIVDHVHFQYNGFLLGFLVLSLSFLGERRDLAGGFVFAALLCTKHLFLVAAPVFFAYCSVTTASERPGLGRDLPGWQPWVALWLRYLLLLSAPSSTTVRLKILPFSLN